MGIRTLMVLFFILYLVGGNFILANGGDKSLIEEKYRAAREYFRQGDYEAAVKGFEEVVKMDPDYKVASDYLRVSRVKLLAKSKKAIALQERKEGLKKVEERREEKRIKSESDFLKIREAWRRWLAKEREKKKLREEKKKEAARLKREKELASYYGIDELQKISRKAQEMIEKAEERMTLQEKREKEMWARIEALPSPKKEEAMVKIYMARAEAAYKEGNYDEAIKEWEKASAVDPSNPLPQRRIENVKQMIERNRQMELEKARRESIAQAKEAVNKYCERGALLYRHKDYKGSIEEYRKALAIDPNSKSAQKGLLNAERALRAGELKKEKELQKKAREISKLVNKGNRYLLERKFLKAKQYALKALRLDADSALAKTLLEKAEAGLTQK